MALVQSFELSHPTVSITMKPRINDLVIPYLDTTGLISLTETETENENGNGNDVSIPTSSPTNTRWTPVMDRPNLNTNSPIRFETDVTTARYITPLNRPPNVVFSPTHSTPIMQLLTTNTQLRLHTADITTARDITPLNSPMNGAVTEHNPDSTHHRHCPMYPQPSPDHHVLPSSVSHHPGCSSGNGGVGEEVIAVVLDESWFIDPHYLFEEIIQDTETTSTIGGRKDQPLPTLLDPSSPVKVESRRTGQLETASVSRSTTPVFTTTTRGKYSYEPHPVHPDCPNSLKCLKDTVGKPKVKLPIIVRAAILGSLKKRLKHKEIYADIEAKFPYYQYQRDKSNWQKSVRYTLKRLKCFHRETSPDKDDLVSGAYWKVILPSTTTGTGPGTGTTRDRSNEDSHDPYTPGTPSTRPRSLYHNPQWSPAARTNVTRLRQIKRRAPWPPPASVGNKRSRLKCSPVPWLSPKRMFPLPLSHVHEQHEGGYHRRRRRYRPPEEEEMQALEAEVENLARLLANEKALSRGLAERMGDVHAKATRAEADLETVQGQLDDEVEGRKKVQRELDRLGKGLRGKRLR